jgi:hypothetical protein
MPHLIIIHLPQTGQDKSSPRLIRSHYPKSLLGNRKKAIHGAICFRIRGLAPER